MEEKKSLTDLEISHSYSSDNSNLLKEFYLPALSVAREYYRITGYFSAKSLAVAAEGISELIENGGKIKLITGLFTDKRDIIAVEETKKNPEAIILEMSKIIDTFGDLKDVFIKECIKAFAWMVAKGLLEIKIAIPIAKYKDQYESLFHQKIGIIEDDKGNAISFSGSINETGAAWLSNIENFKVFKEWERDERSYFEADKNTFFKLWNNLSDRVAVIDIDEAIKKKIVLLAPSNKEDINLDILQGNISKYKKDNLVSPIPPLRDYQERALIVWKDREYEGILEMATGTGKTIVGIKALETFFDREKRGICIITAPTNEICNNWSKRINNLIENDLTVLVGSSNPKWKKLTFNALHDFDKKRNDRLIFISTYDSLDKLSDIIIKYPNTSSFLIADEVHSFGAENRSKILSNESFSRIFNYRLGLSATPERLFDEEGNKLINNFFKGIIFKYTLGEAIKDNILAPYTYYIKVVEMSPQEFSEYIRLTKKIIKAYHTLKNDQENDFWNILIMQRAKIIKSSHDKINKFSEILKSLIVSHDIKYTLIFCLDFQQLEDMAKILDSYKVIYSKITGEETKEERESILGEFARGGFDVLLSIKILDEGVDIPEIKNAIILSSSRNPREYVQRRGRVLRKISNYDKIAKIYDFVVVPKVKNETKDDLFDFERNIIRKELTRMFEFVKYSKNTGEIFKNDLLVQVIKNYNLGEMYSILTDKK